MDRTGFVTANDVSKKRSISPATMLATTTQPLANPDSNSVSSLQRHMLCTGSLADGEIAREGLNVKTNCPLHL